MERKDPSIQACMNKDQIEAASFLPLFGRRDWKNTKLLEKHLKGEG
jgi:hypothetical protein